MQTHILFGKPSFCSAYDHLVDLTGDHQKAMVLRQFLYWCTKRADFDQFKKESIDNNNDQPIFGWIYKSASQLSSDCKLRISRQNMRTHIKDLVANNWISERTDPEAEDQLNRPFQYRLNILNINNDLEALGYTLSGYMLSNHPTIIRKQAKNIQIPTIIKEEGDSIFDALEKIIEANTTILQIKNSGSRVNTSGSRVNTSGSRVNTTYIYPYKVTNKFIKNNNFNKLLQKDADVAQSHTFCPPLDTPISFLNSSQAQENVAPFAEPIGDESMMEEEGQLMEESSDSEIETTKPEPVGLPFTEEELARKKAEMRAAFMKSLEEPLVTETLNSPESDTQVEEHKTEKKTNRDITAAVDDQDTPPIAKLDTPDDVATPESYTLYQGNKISMCDDELAVEINIGSIASLPTLVDEKNAIVKTVKTRASNKNAITKNASAEVAKMDAFTFSETITETLCRFPENAELNEMGRAIAKKARIHETHIENLFTLFKNYWTELDGKKALKKDWSKTWSNWCIRTAGRREFIFPIVVKQTSADLATQGMEILREARLKEAANAAKAPVKTTTPALFSPPMPAQQPIQEDPYVLRYRKAQEEEYNERRGSGRN